MFFPWDFLSNNDQQTFRCTKTYDLGVPVMAQWLMNPTGNYEVAGLIPDLAQWVNDPALS